MKILSAEQIRQWDQYTIQHEPISSIELMERAARCCTAWVAENYHPTKKIKIFCAKGNNGGDGLAIARQLAERNFLCEVYIIEQQDKGSEDFESNLNRLQASIIPVHFINSNEAFPAIDNDNLVIDALFGTGLNRPLQGLPEALVQHINQSNATIISIDMPSGIFADVSSAGATIINATHTLTFQVIKLCFLLPENDEHTGEVHVLDIGLHNDYLAQVDTGFEYIDPLFISSIYKPRNKFSHKGTFGHCLIIAGSMGKMGAAILTSKAVLRSGAGLVTTAVPENYIPIIQTALPEAMAIARIELDDVDWQNYAAVGIGPGLGTHHDTAVLLWKTMRNYKRPMVIDADALNLLAQHKDKWQLIPPQSILTPHPKEFERLFGSFDNQFERFLGALGFAKQLQCFIIIKGHFTFIACPDGKGFFNSTGNAGMATAGSGDVLTGIITGLFAQGYSSLHAVLLGVYLHGLAGDVAAEHLSMEGLIAGDIIEHLGEAFSTISKY